MLRARYAVVAKRPSVVRPVVISRKLSKKDLVSVEYIVLSGNWHR